jgi:DNA-binding transcriptional ArsR family regulator
MSPNQEHNILDDLPEIPDDAFITDPSQFEALASPVRMRSLKLCHEPLSVREVAQRLDMPVTSLYYHVNLLEDAGFLQIVHTRKSGARIEKVYRVAGRSITPGPELLANIEDTAAAAKAMTAIVIEPARAESEHALQKRFEGHEQRMGLGRTLAVLTPTQVDELGSRIRDFIDEFMGGEQESDDPEARRYAFTYTLLPSELD